MSIVTCLAAMLWWLYPATAMAQGGDTDAARLQYVEQPAAGIVDLGQDGPPAGSTIAWLRSLTRRSVVGREESPGAMFFGSVRDVTFFETGIIVTDDLATSVTGFSLDGSVIWSLQSEGDGPRDLRAPLSTSAVGRRVYVGEQRGVKVFDLDSAHQPQYVATGAVAAPPYRQCVSGRDVILQSWDPTAGFLARRFDAELRPTGTGYARLVVSGPSVGPSQLGFAYAEGLVACLSEGAVVVAPRTSIPEIRAFEADGRLRWRVRLENYRPLITRRVPGGFATLPPENGYHRVESVTPLNDGRVLVQVALMSLETLAAGSYIELRSMVFDGQSGHLLETDTSLPPIVAAGAGCVAARPPGAIPVVEVLCPPR